MSDLDAINQVAERFVAAITSGDREGLQQVFDPSAVIWHNTTRVEKQASEAIDAIAAMFGSRRISYEAIRRSLCPTGFTQQHVVTSPDAAGDLFEMPACIVGTVRDGKIVRLEEYYDSAQRVGLR